MNSTGIIVSRAIDVTLTVLLADKLAAQDVREIRRTIEDVMAGKITEEEAYKSLRSHKGDKLDQLLGRVPSS